MKRTEIVLIGPMKVGKSTVANLLSEQLQLSHIRTDLMRWDYFAKLGWPKTELERKSQQLSEFEFFEFCNALELPMLEMIFQDHANCIFDCGGGNAMYKSQSDIDRLNRLMGDFPNSFLLLPSPDLTDSMLTLNRRNSEYKGHARHFTGDELKMNSEIVKYHLCNPVANHVIYNDSKSPQEVVNQIVDKLVTPQ